MEDVSPGHIRAYLSEEKKRGISAETIHRSYGGLRCFFKFLQRDGIISRNPMELVEKPRRERRLIRPMDPEQVRALLAQPDPKTFLGLRNKVMMLLMLDSGLRLSEVLGIRLCHVDINGGGVVVMGKGRKERSVPFAETLRRALRSYLGKRAKLRAGGDLLFVSRKGRRLTGRHVQIIVRRYGRQAGIEGVRLSPHTLRHTFATQYIRNGGDPFSLQAILGHSTLEMVRNYVNLASRDIMVQHKKFSPLDCLFAGRQPGLLGEL
ncbi:MAG: tyrosine-type recombinase/integrase [Elusimicrobiota bacterium]